jgi:hypothetical protein
MLTFKGEFNTNYLVCIAAPLKYVSWTVRNSVYPRLELGFLITAITFEYLKAEIVSISKPYLENLVYK